MEGMTRLFQTNLDQGLGGLLDLIESHAAEKESRQEFELDQISTSRLFEWLKWPSKSRVVETIRSRKELLESRCGLEKMSCTKSLQEKETPGNLCANERGPCHLSCQKLMLSLSPKSHWLFWNRSWELVLICLQMQKLEISKLGCQGEKPLYYFALNHEAQREDEEKDAQPNLIILALFKSFMRRKPDPPSDLGRQTVCQLRRLLLACWDPLDQRNFRIHFSMNLHIDLGIFGKNKQHREGEALENTFNKNNPAPEGEHIWFPTS